MASFYHGPEARGRAIIARLHPGMNVTSLFA
jgi:hypothetical protein